MTNPPYYGPPQPAWGTPPASGPSRVPMVLAFVGIVIAIGVGVGGWFLSSAETAASAEDTRHYSAQQVADAKTAMCAAYAKAATSVAGAASRNSDDPDLKFSYVVNSRLAFHVANDYFRQQLENYPATSPALTTAFQNLISAYDEFLLAQLGDSPQKEIDSASNMTKEADKAVNGACK
jgi:hypothetical protein